MLVLNRKIGEEVLIGHSIRVRVLDVQGNRVKLGLIAPDSVRFARSELLEADVCSAADSAATGRAACSAIR